MLAQVFTHIALHENDYLEANYVKSLFEGWNDGPTIRTLTLPWPDR